MNRVPASEAAGGFVRLLKLLLIPLISAVPAMADSVYQIAGDIVVVGNNVCSGPCVETINFSFQMQDQLGLLPNGQYAQVLLPGGTVQSLGPLAPFSGQMVDALLAGEHYVAFFNATSGSGGISAASDEIDLRLVPLGTAPAAPEIFNSVLYGCGHTGSFDPTCVTDFVPLGGAPYATYLSATTQATVTPVPESSTLSYVSVGVGLVVLLGSLQRRPPIRNGPP